MRKKLQPKLSRREQQDLMDRAILRILMKNNLVRWTKLEKNILSTQLPFATSQRFRNRMKYLLKKKLIEKIQRGTYKITEHGRKYLETLESIYANFDERQFLTVK